MHGDSAPSFFNEIKNTRGIVPRVIFVRSFFLEQEANAEGCVEGVERGFSQVE